MAHARLGALVVVILAGGGPAAAGTSVPLESFMAGLWTVRVELPDGGPRWRFLVDTGSTHTVVSPAAAHAAGVTVTPGTVLRTPGGLVAAGEADLPPFRLGGGLQPGLRVRVVPLADVGGDSRLDGILGMDALGGWPMVLDVAGARLEFGEGAPGGAGDGIPVPARVQDGRVVVEVRVDGVRRTMVLDSGASMPVVFDATASGAPAALGTAGGRQSARAARAELRVGDVVLGGVATLQVPPPQGRTGSDGLLPVALFSRVFIDPARGEVRVVPRR